MSKISLRIAVSVALSMPLITYAQESPTKVSIYGRAQVEVSQADRGTTTDGLSLEDNAMGRVGVKASQDLGDGMSGIAGLEWRIDTSDNEVTTGSGASAVTQTFAQREAFIGLSASWGTLQLGNLQSPYKYTGGVKYDPFVATTLEARGNGGMSAGSFGHNSFIADALSYKSPKIANSVTIWALYSPDEVNRNARGAEGDYSISAIFEQKTWEVFVAAATDDSASLDRIKGGGGVTLGQHRIMAQMESSDTAGVESDLLFVGYNFKFNKTTLVVQAGQTEPETGASTDYLVLGAIHQFTSKYRVFGGYRNTDAGTAETQIISLGLRLDFQS